MPGFFNQENGWRKAMQAYNYFVASVALYDLVTNPEKVYELAPDILIHLYTGYTYRGSNSGLADLGSMALNMSRLGSIYSGMTTACTSLSAAVNLADVANHLLNVGTSLLTDGRDSPTEENEPSALKLN